MHVIDEIFNEVGLKRNDLVHANETSSIVESEKYQKYDRKMLIKLCIWVDLSFGYQGDFQTRLDELLEIFNGGKEK